MAVNPSIQLGTSGNWAIKEDNLLAYKQLGNKFFDREFDFSRGTTATFVGRNGFIQESGLNGTEIVTNGDFATDSDWSKTNATISNGLATITVTNGGYSAINQSITYATGKEYIITAQVQGLSGSSGKQIKFQDRGNNTGGLNIANGLITLDETLQNIEISWTANSNSDIIVISRSSNSGDYSFTIDNVSIKEIQLDVPRIDFTDDPTGHLLLEPQSTNLIPYSSDYSNGWVYFDASTSANTLISPSGVLDASKFIEGSGSSIKRIINLSQSIVSGNDYTFSIFAKKGERDFITLTNNTGSADVTTTFDLTNGTVTSGIGSINSFTNGWFRCSRSFTATATVTSSYIAQAFINNGSGIFYQGDGTSGIYIWGAQLEELSYPTSYIPTSGSTSTRNQEICNNSGTVNDFNSEEGVLYADISALADDGTARTISINNTASNRVFLQLRAASGQVVSGVVKNGVVQGFASYSISQTSNIKLAIKYKQNDFSLFVNGAKIATTSGDVFTSGTLNSLNFSSGSGAVVASTEYFFGKTKNVKAFKRALTDTELYLLTVTQYQSYQEMATALNYTL